MIFMRPGGLYLCIELFFLLGFSSAIQGREYKWSTVWPLECITFKLVGPIYGSNPFNQSGDADDDEILVPPKLENNYLPANAKKKSDETLSERDGSVKKKKKIIRRLPREDFNQGQEWRKSMVNIGWRQATANVMWKQPSGLTRPPSYRYMQIYKNYTRSYSELSEEVTGPVASEKVQTDLSGGVVYPEELTIYSSVRTSKLASVDSSTSEAPQTLAAYSYRTSVLMEVMTAEAGGTSTELGGRQGSERPATEPLHDQSGLKTTAILDYSPVVIVTDRSSITKSLQEVSIPSYSTIAHNGKNSVTDIEKLEDKKTSLTFQNKTNNVSDLTTLCNFNTSQTLNTPPTSGRPKEMMTDTICFPDRITQNISASALLTTTHMDPRYLNTEQFHAFINKGNKQNLFDTDIFFSPSSTLNLYSLNQNESFTRRLNNDDKESLRDSDINVFISTPVSFDSAEGTTREVQEDSHLLARTLKAYDLDERFLPEITIPQNTSNKENIINNLHYERSTLPINKNSSTVFQELGFTTNYMDITTNGFMGKGNQQKNPFRFNLTAIPSLKTETPSELNISTLAHDASSVYFNKSTELTQASLTQLNISTVPQTSSTTTSQTMALESVESTDHSSSASLLSRNATVETSTNILQPGTKTLESGTNTPSSTVEVSTNTVETVTETLQTETVTVQCRTESEKDHSTVGTTTEVDGTLPVSCNMKTNYPMQISYGQESHSINQSSIAEGSLLGVNIPFKSSTGRNTGGYPIDSTKSTFIRASEIAFNSTNPMDHPTEIYNVSQYNSFTTPSNSKQTTPYLLTNSTYPSDKSVNTVSTSAIFYMTSTFYLKGTNLQNSSVPSATSALNETSTLLSQTPSTFHPQPDTITSLVNKFPYTDFPTETEVYSSPNVTEPPVAGQSNLSPPNASSPGEYRISTPQPNGTYLETIRTILPPQSGTFLEQSRTIPPQQNGTYLEPSCTAPHQQSGTYPEPSRTIPPQQNGTYLEPSRTILPQQNGTYLEPSRTILPQQNGTYLEPSRTIPHQQNGTFLEPSCTAPPLQAGTYPESSHKHNSTYPKDSHIEPSQQKDSYPSSGSSSPLQIDAFSRISSPYPNIMLTNPQSGLSYPMPSNPYPSTDQISISYNRVSPVFTETSIPYTQSSFIYPRMTSNSQRTLVYPTVPYPQINVSYTQTSITYPQTSIIHTQTNDYPQTGIFYPQGRPMYPQTSAVYNISPTYPQTSSIYPPSSSNLFTSSIAYPFSSYNISQTTPIYYQSTFYSQRNTMYTESNSYSKDNNKKKEGSSERVEISSWRSFYSLNATRPDMSNANPPRSTTAFCSPNNANNLSSQNVTKDVSPSEVSKSTEASTERGRLNMGGRPGRLRPQANTTTGMFKAATGYPDVFTFPYRHYSAPHRLMPTTGATFPAAYSHIDSAYRKPTMLSPRSWSGPTEDTSQQIVSLRFQGFKSNVERVTGRHPATTSRVSKSHSPITSTVHPYVCTSKRLKSGRYPSSSRPGLFGSQSGFDYRQLLMRMRKIKGHVTPKYSDEGRSTHKNIHMKKWPLPGKHFSQWNRLYKYRKHFH